MSYIDSFKISEAGMNVERMRLDAIAQNLANQHTIATDGSAPYAPVSVIASPSAVDFSNLLDGQFHPVAPKAMLVQQNVSPRKSYEPDNPMADSQGFVSYPGVNKVNEMTTMMMATRAYEADVKAMNAAKSMALSALDIGEKS